MDTTVYEKLLNASFRFVSYRPRSEKEIRDFLTKKLTRWKVFGGTVVQKVIDRLTELGYVDDTKFTRWWIEQRNTFQPKGMRLIAHELKAKGVSRELIEELLKEESRQFSHDRGKIDVVFDEVLVAKRAIQKKISLWQRLPLLEKKKKIYAFLGRRGFEGETISRIIDEITEKE